MNRPASIAPSLSPSIAGAGEVVVLDVADQAHAIADDVLTVQRTAAEQGARDAARLDASIRAAQALTCLVYGLALK